MLTSFLVSGFPYGFMIHYNGPTSSSFGHNHTSFQANEHTAKKKLQSKIDSGRMVGPFDEPRFPNFHVSPLGLIPKRDSSDFRLILNLSYPKGSSINDYIPKEYLSVQYETLDHVVDCVTDCGPQALLAKI